MPEVTSEGLEGRPFDVVGSSVPAPARFRGAPPETATLRPIFVERARSFFEANDGFRGEGRERRVRRFEWLEGVGRP